MQHQYRIDALMNVLNTLRNGKAMEEGSEKLTGLVRECQDSENKGEIIIKLQIVPDGFGRYEIKDTITVKSPKHAKSSTIFYATPECQLQKNDPAQTELEFPRVVQNSAPVKSVAEEKPTAVKTV
jgi:hypothetical protein